MQSKRREKKKPPPKNKWNCSKLYGLRQSQYFSCAIRLATPKPDPSRRARARTSQPPTEHRSKHRGRAKVEAIPGAQHIYPWPLARERGRSQTMVCRAVSDLCAVAPPSPEATRLFLWWNWKKKTFKLVRYCRLVAEYSDGGDTGGSLKCLNVLFHDWWKIDAMMLIIFTSVFTKTQNWQDAILTFFKKHFSNFGFPSNQLTLWATT